MAANPFNHAGSASAILAPPWLSGERLRADHYLRFFLAFFLYYLGLPVALLLHFLGVYHVRNYALDVSAFAFGWFASRKYLHFVLRAESPGPTWLRNNNYVGMLYPSVRSFLGSKSSDTVTISGKVYHLARYDSLLHCMVDFMIRMTPAPAPLLGNDDKAAGAWFRQHYEGKSQPPTPPGATIYERLETGAVTLSQVRPIPPDFMPFVPLAIGFLLWWAVLDFRGFSRLVRRYIGFDISRLLRFRF